MKKVSLSSLKNVPAFLEKYSATFVGQKLSSGFLKVEANFSKDVYIKFRYLTKDGSSTENLKYIKIDDLDFSSQEFIYSYYYKSKAAEKRREITFIKTADDLPA